MIRQQQIKSNNKGEKKYAIYAIVSDKGFLSFVLSKIF